MYSTNNKGFTLIELLVVIAIIGILSSVVLASLNSARQKSRDARRIADIKQIQLALELYFDSSRSYPVGAESGANFTGMAPTYIATIPVDPTNLATGYQYKSLTAGATPTDCTASPCNYYHLGASMEESGNTALTGDRDLGALGITDNFDGLNGACDASTGADTCYDVTP